MKKDKRLKIKLISTNDVDSVFKHAEQGEFADDDEVYVGDAESISKFKEILDGLDDDGNPKMKRTSATNIELISKDETGAIISLDYTCPNCHYPTGEVIFVGASGVSTINSSFETNLVCVVCNKEVTVECRF